MTLQRTLRAEGGFALIEVVVSAAVLAIVALAILSGIDAANGASAREKARAVAASLAEADQERLRSMNIDKVSAPPQQEPQTVDGVTYEVKSEAKWITDNIGGAPGCGETGDQVEYLHITTTVTSKIIGEGKPLPPVKIESLVAPSAKKAESQGILGVKVVDRNGAGVPNITVTATSPAFSPPSDVTDSNGCVIFTTVPVGTYTITLNTAGFVDRKGEQVSTATQLVAPKKVSWVNMTYDRTTSAQATIRTHTPGKVWSETDAKTSKASFVSTTNGASVGFIKTVEPAAGTNVATFPGLFPFAENSYTFFTGECAYASPDKHSVNYFSTTNPDAALLSDPANLQPQPVKVRQPPFNLRVTRNYSGNSFNDGKVEVWVRMVKPSSSSSDDCVMPWVQLTTAIWPNGIWGNKSSNNTHFVTQSGTFDPGMPFGKYKICLRDLDNSNRVWNMSDEYDNTHPDGQQTTTNLGSSSGWSSTSNASTNRCKT